jgi:protein-S-isoprenylcysteine O-methyltransferase Ste14
MKLSAPKQITWIIALILGVVGILANVAAIPVVTPAIGFWLLVVGWLLLLIATITHGL